MAPHLLTLPAEICYRILEYASQHDHFSTCNEEYDDDNAHRRPLRNPNISLWLICKHIYTELKIIGVSKLSLRVCTTTCALRYFEPNMALWKTRVGYFRRFYEAWEIASFERDGETLEEYVDGRREQQRGFAKDYTIEGAVKDPVGVDVAFYP